MKLVKSIGHFYYHLCLPFNLEIFIKSQTLAFAKGIVFMKLLIMKLASPRSLPYPT